MIVLLFLSSCSSQRISKLREDDLLKYLHNSESRLEDSILLKTCREKGVHRALKEVKNIKNDAKFWNDMGICYFLMKNYTKANFSFDMAFEKNRHYPNVLNNLGVMNIHFQNYKKAFYFLERAHRRNPRLLIPGLNLSSLYLRFQRFESARRVLNMLHRHHKKNQDVKKLLDIVK